MDGANLNLFSVVSAVISGNKRKSVHSKKHEIVIGFFLCYV